VGILEGRTAFITGGASGVGRACALRFAAEGAGDLPDLALYLAADASSFLTGQTIYIDGGQSLKKYPELFSFMRGERAAGAPSPSPSPAPRERGA
jgi:NAD(P)-dependent dehydrogenase (short-subunit alcohol dehydrogenase family)